MRPESCTVLLILPGGVAGAAPRHDAVTEQPRSVSRSAAASQQRQQQEQQPVMLPPATLPYGAYEPPQHPPQQPAQWPTPGWAAPLAPVEHTPSMAAASTLGEQILFHWYLHLKLKVLSSTFPSSISCHIT